MNKVGSVSITIRGKVLSTKELSELRDLVARVGVVDSNKPYHRRYSNDRCTKGNERIL